MAEKTVEELNATINDLKAKLAGQVAPDTTPKHSYRVLHGGVKVGEGPFGKFTTVGEVVVLTEKQAAHIGLEHLADESEWSAMLAADDHQTDLAAKQAKAMEEAKKMGRDAKKTGLPANFASIRKAATAAMKAQGAVADVVDGGGTKQKK